MRKKIKTKPQFKSKPKQKIKKVPDVSLLKVPTGINGFDEITIGGLPKGRPTLVCGSAGCGKTLLAMEFLVRGAIQFHEPGVFIAFEENAEELAQNVASLGFDLDDLARKKKIIVDYIFIERSEIEETGDYDLEGLFIRLKHAIKSIGAKRVVIDTIEVLFSGFSNPHILRAELRRLFRWLKEQGVTAIITGEKGGEGTLTRYGLEEYVADCVIVLDHRITDQISTRRLRIVKYRGSLHGTNEYPFLIKDSGFSILPITSVGLNHKATDERLSTGVPRLDVMLGGKGYYRGSSILVSGTAGTGKTILALHLVNDACRRGERCLYLASEESTAQIIRNAKSIGINLEPWIQKKLLYFNVSRPTYTGLEMQLVTLDSLLKKFRPSIVVIDPITGLTSIGSSEEVKSMLMRMIDILKSNYVTTLCTSLTHGGNNIEQTEVAVTSLIDTWILVREIEHNGERTRGLYVLKSRGMPHSNQIREFLITNKGIDLTDVYVGQGMVLTGAARKVQELKEKAAFRAGRDKMERIKRELERRRLLMEAKINEIHAEYESLEEEMHEKLKVHEAQEKALVLDKSVIAQMRKADHKIDQDQDQDQDQGQGQDKSNADKNSKIKASEVKK
ncbi:MAG: circadian clock protein KaiC [Oligoflexia bacterium]|nr:circadian clock protein KaiC [Oligoflexia bacterium]